MAPDAVWSMVESHILPPQGIVPCNLPLTRIEHSICWQAETCCLTEEGWEIFRLAILPKGSVNNWVLKKKSENLGEIPMENTQ